MLPALAECARSPPAGRAAAGASRSFQGNARDLCALRRAFTSSYAAVVFHCPTRRCSSLLIFHPFTLTAMAPMIATPARLQAPLRAASHIQLRGGGRSMRCFTRAGPSEWGLMGNLRPLQQQEWQVRAHRHQRRVPRRGSSAGQRWRAGGSQRVSLPPPRPTARRGLPAPSWRPPGAL